MFGSLGSPRSRSPDDLEIEEVEVVEDVVIEALPGKTSARSGGSSKFSLSTMASLRKAAAKGELVIEELEDISKPAVPPSSWKSIDLRVDRASIENRERLASRTSESSEFKTIASLHKKTAPGTLRAAELEVGDIIFVHGKGAVHWSQQVTKLFSSSVTKGGSDESVHCMLVSSIDEAGIHSQVAHVTRNGGQIGYITDPIDPTAAAIALLGGPEAAATLDPSVIESTTSFASEQWKSANCFVGAVYRLGPEFARLKSMAGYIAADIVTRFTVRYNTAGSVRSVFKDPEVGHFLRRKTSKVFKPSSRSSSRRTSGKFGSPKVKVLKTSSSATVGRGSGRSSKIWKGLLECTSFDPVSPVGPGSPEAKQDGLASRIASSDVEVEPFALADKIRAVAEIPEERTAEIVWESAEPEDFGSTTRLRTHKSSQADEVQEFSLFCSEFVIKCYQEALAQLGDPVPDEFLRVIDLKGSACSPMCFQGFLNTNSKTLGDWKFVGKVQAEFM